MVGLSSLRLCPPGNGSTSGISLAYAFGDKIMKRQVWLSLLIAVQLCFPIRVFAQEAAPRTIGKGTHVLDAATLGSISSLKISRGATAVIDFGNASQLTLPGDLLNK